MIGLLIAGALGYMLGEDDKICAHNREVRLHNARIRENNRIEDRRIEREKATKFNEDKVKFKDFEAEIRTELGKDDDESFPITDNDVHWASTVIGDIEGVGRFQFSFNIWHGSKRIGFRSHHSEPVISEDILIRLDELGIDVDKTITEEDEAGE